VVIQPFAWSFTINREIHGAYKNAQDLRRKLRDLGCSSEISHVPGLISVDVPPDVALADVRSVLDVGQNQQLWDYEEATLGHSVQ
jgi:hypothetical protein